MSFMEPGWGSLVFVSADYQVSEVFLLFASFSRRGLLFPEIPCNINDWSERLDLDLSGVALSIGFALAF